MINLLGSVHKLAEVLGLWVNDHAYSTLTALVGVPATITAYRLLARNIRISFQLLRHYHEEAGLAGLTASRRLACIAVQDWAWTDRSKLLRFTRIWIERDIFADVDLQDAKEKERSNPRIVVRSPSEIVAHFADVKHYLTILQDLKPVHPEKDSDDWHKFVCPVEIIDGFIAPIHLLTGLLNQFDQKWAPILGSFNKDASDTTSFGSASTDMRQIQMFIYTCWLLWGPSVPICTCERWKADHQSVQYGFGDENNSIELIGEAEALQEQVNELFDHAVARDSTKVPMALWATVKGKLQLSKTLGKHNPPALIDSSVGGQDERPVLFLSEIVDGDARLGDATQTRKDHGSANAATTTSPATATNAATARNYKSKYYSAYLWIAFVLLRKVGENWVPATGGGKGEQAWKVLVPFFEHGNLADPETYQFSKQQLAIKATNAIIQIAQAWPKKAPMRFAYACAIDNSGCGKDLAYPDRNRTPTGEPLPLLREMVEDIVKKKKLKEPVLFDYFTNEWHPYSACDLPARVAEHYEAMKKREMATTA